MKDSQQRLPSIVTPKEVEVPDIKVVDEDGREIVRPDVLQAVVQLASLGQLVRIRKSLEKEEVEGKEDSRTLGATDQIQWLDLIDDWPHVPWATATFVNDGLNPVFIRLNDLETTRIPPLNVGESYVADYTKADKRIGVVYYWCNAGLTASVRVRAKY